MRRLFQARGDENLPTPRRQFAERLQQATDLGVTADDALRVEAFVGHLQQPATSSPVSRRASPSRRSAAMFRAIRNR